MPERGISAEELRNCPAAVDIRFDGHGIPHIRTDDEEALWFAQGYVHARDRFFQMELARRLAAGRLAEVLGPQALVSDRKMRTWRLAASARRQAALLDGDVECLGKPLVACIGPITAKTARELGLRVDVEASEHTVPGLVRALRERFGE